MGFSRKGYCGGLPCYAYFNKIQEIEWPRKETQTHLHCQYTITRSCPNSAFTSDDLPTFGRPTTVTRMASDSDACSTGGSVSTIRSQSSATPRPCSADTGQISSNPIRKNSAADR